MDVDKPLSVTDAVQLAKEQVASTDPVDAYLTADLLTQFVLDQFDKPSASIIVDQPPPIANSHKPSWELVIGLVERMAWHDENDSMIGVLGQNKRVRDLLLVDMRERDRVGRERYGTPLQAGNGRRHLVDAYQELLDFIVYIQTWAEENNIDLHTMRNFGDLPQPEKTGARIFVSIIHEGIYKAAVIRELIERGC